MSKIYNNKITNNIIYSLLIIGILVLGIMFALPAKTQAWNGYGFESTASIQDYGNVGNNSYGYNSANNNNTATQNPIPSITTLSLDRADVDSDPKAVTITGKNFIPSGVVKWDNADRPTTYVNSKTLLVQINKKDLSKTGEHLISVYNPGPGGGYSNIAIFTVNKDKSSNNLGANALFGNSNFFPHTFVGWLALAIIILLIVIIWRRMIANSDRNKKKPLKHH